MKTPSGKRAGHCSRMRLRLTVSGRGGGCGGIGGGMNWDMGAPGQASTTPKAKEAGGAHLQGCNSFDQLPLRDLRCIAMNRAVINRAAVGVDDCAVRAEIVG